MHPYSYTHGFLFVPIFYSEHKGEIMHFFGVIWKKIALHMVLIYHPNLKKYGRTAISNGAIRN